MYLKRREYPNLRSRARLHVSERQYPLLAFKSAAARRKALSRPGAPQISNARDLTTAVLAKQIDGNYCDRITVHFATHVREPRKASTSKPPVRLEWLTGKPRNREEFAGFCAKVAQVANGKGWRQPSAKPKNWASTSLVEHAMIAAGQMEPSHHELSKRGEARRAAEAAMREAIANERQDGIDSKYLHSHARKKGKT